jgi:hypothetical protein
MLGYSSARIARPGLAAIKDMITQQAAVVVFICQLKVLMFARLIEPVVAFSPQARPAN